jgi:hypothetical protein
MVERSGHVFPSSNQTLARLRPVTLIGASNQLVFQ